MSNSSWIALKASSRFFFGWSFEKVNMLMRRCPRKQAEVHLSKGIPGNEVRPRRMHEGTEGQSVLPATSSSATEKASEG